MHGGGQMNGPALETVGYFLFTGIISLLVAYYAMVIAAKHRELREKVERSRKRKEGADGKAV